MGGRSGGSYGKSARPAFEGGRGGTSRSLGAAAYRPAVIEQHGKHIDSVIKDTVAKVPKK